MTNGTCRKCGAALAWIKTPAGKNMPCDATPMYYREKRGGAKRIVTPSGDVISCDLVLSTIFERPTGVGYIPHWASCPHAGDFRKKSSHG